MVFVEDAPYHQDVAGFDCKRQREKSQNVCDPRPQREATSIRYYAPGARQGEIRHVPYRIERANGSKESKHLVRSRSESSGTMVGSADSHGHHPGAEALLNLPLGGRAHIRPVADCRG